jgi:hypothetical protein
MPKFHLNDPAFFDTINASCQSPIGKVDSSVTIRESAALDCINNRNAFVRALNTLKNTDNIRDTLLYDLGIEVINQAEAVVHLDKVIYLYGAVEIEQPDQQPILQHLIQLNTKRVTEVNEVMVFAKAALDPNLNNTQRAQNAMRLAKLAHSVSGCHASKFKALGIGLLVFSAVTFIAASALVFLLAGGPILISLAAIAAVTTASVSAGITGAAAIDHSREPSLAHSVRMFKNAVYEPEKPEQISSEQGFF